MRLLIAIKSCERDMLNGCHTAIRETWGKDFPPNVDVRFFVGNGSASLKSDEVRLAAAKLIETLRASGADVKWAEPENLHLTLMFFGATLPERLPQLEALMAQAAQRPAFRISFNGLGAFPSWDEPRVVWVGVGEGSRELVSLAEALGVSEERPFSAHLTIGRVRSRRSGEKLKAVAAQARFPELFQDVGSLVLYESRLTPQGPVYTIRGRTPLKGA